jgi:glycosyltransferase involved in cell wall biosynthesis
MPETHDHGTTRCLVSDAHRPGGYSETIRRTTTNRCAYHLSVTPSLSIVIPVFNEPDWIGVVVADAVTAVQRSSFADPELIIVDDGSDEATQAALTRLETPFPLRVVRQDNRGRFLARQTGVEAARGDLVLLLDARVSLHADSLAFVCEQLGKEGNLPLWNAHCDIELKGNPYARFWNTLTEVAYRDYCANPRTLSYGIEEFDRYPKGTGCFIAPREALREAIANFDSRYADTRDANDDTSVIRLLAARQPINISPGFACVYRSRDAFVPFLRHAFHRGVHFVDGWARPGGRFFGVIVAFYPLTALAVLLALRRPRWAAAATLAAPLAGVGGGAALGRSRADCAALGMLGPAWLAVYGAGMWRGLWLLLRARAAR